MELVMRKALAVLIELAGGLVLAVVLVVGARFLLQSRSLAYLVLPLLCVVAVALGFWRGRASMLAPWQFVPLLILPMVLLILFTAGRAWRLLSLPIGAVAFVAM